jgi:hypothetical protein
MRRLEERTGVGPDVRPGGITVYAISLLQELWLADFSCSQRDSSIFDPEGPALVLDMSSVRHLHPAFITSILIEEDFSLEAFFAPHSKQLRNKLTSSLMFLCFSGPAFFESLSVFPNTSRFIVDVNLGNNSVEIAENQIRAAVNYLGWERIFSLECMFLIFFELLRF